MTDRIHDLEQNIRDSYAIIRDDERTIQVSDRPEEKLRARREIDRHWALIEGYLQEYLILSQGAASSELIQIAAHFPRLAAQFHVAAATPAPLVPVPAPAPPPDSFQYDVFISYSRQDGEWVRNVLLPRLEAARLRVAIDKLTFEFGVSRMVNIERAIDASRHTLIILTPDWVVDQWNEFEGLLTGSDDPAGQRRKLVPCQLKPCELPKRISMLTAADLTDPHDRDMLLNRLVESLRPTANSNRS